MTCSQKCNTTSDEIVDILDANYNIIGTELRDLIHKKNLLHFIVNIFIFNSKGKLLIQRRSLNKKHYPGYWDLSCSEHLQHEETFEQAAQRGLKEELQISIHTSQLKLLRKEHKYCDCVARTFSVVYDGAINVNKQEVSEIRFVSLEELEKEMSSNVTKFTPWFVDEFQCYLENK